MSVKRLIRVPMTDAEKIATGKELADQEVAWKAAEDERTARRAELNEAVNIHRNRVRELAKQLHEAHVDRLVDCDWTIDLEAGLKRLIRSDNREILEEAKLTGPELQMSLLRDGMERLIKEVEAGDPGPQPPDPESQETGTDDEESNDVEP